MKAAPWSLGSPDAHHNTRQGGAAASCAWEGAQDRSNPALANVLGIDMMQRTAPPKSRGPSLQSQRSLPLPQPLHYGAPLGWPCPRCPDRTRQRMRPTCALTATPHSFYVTAHVPLLTTIPPPWQLPLPPPSPRTYQGSGLRVQGAGFQASGFRATDVDVPSPPGLLQLAGPPAALPVHSVRVCANSLHAHLPPTRSPPSPKP